MHTSFLKIVAKGLVVVALLGGGVGVANAQTKQSHSESDKTKTTSSHRYSRSKPAANRWVCPTCGSDYAAAGNCTKDKALTVKQGMYYCPNHTDKQNVDPGKCRKCKTKMVIADSRKAQEQRKAKLPDENEAVVDSSSAPTGN